MIDLEQSLERLRSDSQFQITVGLTIFFLAIFPAYFSYAASVGGSTGLGPSGTWLIEYEETVAASGEDAVFVDDGTAESITFSVPELNGMWLGVILLNFTYAESDEGGFWPDQCDDVTAEIDASGLSGYNEGGSMLSISASECGDYGLKIVLKQNYTGENLTREGTQGDLSQTLGEHDGNGRGDFGISISVDTNTGSKPGPLDPGPGSNSEDGEEVLVTWEVIAYELSFTPIEN